MADKLDIPVLDSKPPAATEQHIDPWDVQAAVDEQGNVQAFDCTYTIAAKILSLESSGLTLLSSSDEAISKYIFLLTLSFSRS